MYILGVKIGNMITEIIIKIMNFFSKFDIPSLVSFEQLLDSIEIQ